MIYWVKFLQHTVDHSIVWRVLYVLCPFRMWAVLALHIFLSLVTITNFYSLPFLFVTPLPSIHTSSLGILFTVALCLSFHQYNICIKFFKTFFCLILCSRNETLFLILRISVLFIVIVIKISWLTCSKYISSSLILFSVCLSLFVSISENKLYLLNSKPYFIYFMSWTILIFAGVTVGVIFKQVFQNSTSWLF